MSAVTLDVVGLLGTLGIEKARHRNKIQIVAACPMHEKILGRKDRHASWGINAITGMHQCYSCGYKGTLEQLVFDVTGEEADEGLIDKLAVQALQRAVALPEEVEEPEVEWEPGELVPLSNRQLDKRYLEPESAEAYGVAWDRSRDCWYMPIYTPKGELICAQYKQAGAVFTLPEGSMKSHYLFGLQVVMQEDTCAVVESPLDAVRLHGIGIPAVATFGASVSREQLRLLNRYFSLVVTAFDNDEPGHIATDYVVKELNALGCATVRFRYRGLRKPDGRLAKDPGDVANDDMLRSAWQRTLRLGL